MEQGICAMGESCLSPLPAQDGATWARSRESMEWVNPACTCSLRLEVSNGPLCMEQGIPPKFKSVELQLVLPLPRACHPWECHFATTVTPPLLGLMPRLLWHIPRGSLASLAPSPARGRSRSQLSLP